MPTCAQCGNPVECSHCTSTLEIGGTTVDCPLKKAQVWVRVDDDNWKHVKGAGVSLGGSMSKEGATDTAGFAIFDELEAGDYTVTLKDLEGTLAESYVLPDTKVLNPKVKTSIAYVNFKIIRRAGLKVKVQDTGERPTLFADAQVFITGADTLDVPTREGIADFGKIKPGKYQIRAVLNEEDAKNFHAPEKTVELRLSPGEMNTMNLEVITLARPRIRLTWGENQAAEGVGVKLKKGGVTHDFGTTNGDGFATLSPDVPGVLPGKYEVELVYDPKVYGLAR